MRTVAPTSLITKIVDWGFAAIAAVLLFGMLAGALHDVSRAWDTWYYHLPFAARLGGIASRSTFELSALNRARFAGFPLLAEAIQATLWRLSGTPVAANLLAFSSLPLFALFLRRRLRIPFHVSILGLLAIPLVQIHATSCYVDLPANVAAAALVLDVIATYASGSPVTAVELRRMLLFAAIASNMKFLLEPIVLLALGMLGGYLVLTLRRAHVNPERGTQLRQLAWFAAALPLIFATALKNVALHHNPAFPERLHAFGQVLPGVEEPYHSAPVWLEHSSEPVRFFASVLELHLQPLMSHARWSIDQWSPPWRDDYRMGGFFGAYVAFELCAMAFICFRNRSRRTRAAALGFALLTAAICVLPQAHELRYYLCWMMVLVGLNRWLVEQARAEWKMRALTAVSLGFLSVVLFSTRFEYVYPSGITLQQLIAQKVDAAVLSNVREGERVCVRQLPFALLWSAAFHPGRHYQLKQAETLADCTGQRVLD